MSLLSRDRLRIGLSPDRLVLAGYRRALRTRLVRKEIIPVPANGPPHWQAAMDALPSALGRTGRGKPEVTVILSNHFVRYALLPWNAALKTDGEWAALARHRLEAVHGQAAGSWALRICETAPRGARMVSAVDTALLDALEARLTECHADLVSVQPYLMAVFNRVRAKIGNASCWLVIAESGRLTLALIERGSWSALRNRRIGNGWQAVLPDLLERESAVLALERPCLQAVIHTQEAFDAGLHGALKVRDVTLAAGAALTDRRLAMALG